MQENRRAARRRVLKTGTIEFDSRAFSCAIRNLSETGAALDVPYALAVPHEFTLMIETDQLNRHCRVIWRKEKRLGVIFEPERKLELWWGETSAAGAAKDSAN